MIIYYRLRDPWDNQDRCLLKEAQKLCLRQILTRQACLLPFVFADEVGIRDDGVREVLYSDAYIQLTAAYRRGNENAAAALLHLHLALAEALKFERRTDAAEDPRFHVAQAFELWNQQYPRTERFRSMMSESLRMVVCGGGSTLTLLAVCQA